MKYASAACFVVFTFVSAPMLADSRSLRSSVGSPVERVVKLLEDLHEKLGLDGRAEQQVYDKYACWCEKTTERKANDITTAQNELRALGQTILSLKGKIATLTSEIEELAAEIEAINAATKKATQLREKANAAFAAETSETKSAMASLEQAINVLIDGTSLLQGSEKASLAVSGVIRAMPSSVMLKPGQFEQLSAFVQAGGNTQYMPQSFTVQGILTDMYKTFAADVETATLNEATSNREFEDFMNLKAEEKARAENLKKKKEGEKAENEERLADTQSIYDDTAAQMAADVKFFDETKAACLSKNKDWKIRKDLRAEEIAGVQAALDILTADGARELFATTIKAGKEVRADDAYDTGRDITAFLQIQSSDKGATAVAAAYAALKQRATEAQSFRLAALAARVRLTKAGHFEEVIDAINKMISDLQVEGEDDIKKRDQCKDEYLKIESTVKNVTWLIKKNVAKIDKLTGLIELRTKQRDQTLHDIDDVDALKADLTAEREEENRVFAAAKQDDQHAIDLLMDARTALTLYYKNNKIAMGPIQGSVKSLALAQQGPEFDVSADQAPEAVFSGKGKRKDESKGIVQIMTMLIEDLNDEIKNDMQAEEAAQLKYENLMDQANALRKKLVTKRVSLDDAIAKRTAERTDEEDDKKDNEADLADEVNYKDSITNDCDFIIRTFEKRASARTAEMEGLAGAKEYLVGATPAPAQAGFVQTQKGSFDDEALPKAQFLGLGR